MTGLPAADRFPWNGVNRHPDITVRSAEAEIHVQITCREENVAACAYATGGSARCRSTTPQASSGTSVFCRWIFRINAAVHRRDVHAATSSAINGPRETSMKSQELIYARESGYRHDIGQVMTTAVETVRRFRAASPSGGPIAARRPASGGRHPDRRAARDAAILELPTPSEARIRAMFGLTAAEAQLAQLASGDTLEEVARKLSHQADDGAQRARHHLFQGRNPASDQARRDPQPYRALERRTMEAA